MKKKVEIMRATPNTYGTFMNLMLLGNTLHESNGHNYSVTIDFNKDIAF